MSTDKAPLPEAVREQIERYREARKYTDPRTGEVSLCSLSLIRYVQDLRDIAAAVAKHERARHDDLTTALEAIQTSTRGDEQQQQWAIRKYLDDRGIFNDNLSGSRRLVAEACKVALSVASHPPPTPEDR